MDLRPSMAVSVEIRAESALLIGFFLPRALSIKAASDR